MLGPGHDTRGANTMQKTTVGLAGIIVGLLIASL
jgi:hypothetical protein